MKRSAVPARPGQQSGPGHATSATRSSPTSAPTSPAPSSSRFAAGISSLIFLFVVGLGEYAVALAAVVALLDVIPMIGATLGAVSCHPIGFATDPHIGLSA